MNVLVTGAGMVGAYAARALGAAGARVVLYDREPQRGALEAIAPGIPVEVGDVLSQSDLVAAMQCHAIDRVLHTAALLPGPDSKAYDIVSVNVLGTASVLEAAKVAGVQRLVHVSSTVVYYGAFAAAAPGVVTEDAPLGSIPGFVYGTTKVAAERIALDYADNGWLDVRVCRLGHVWGFWPGAPRSPIAAMLAITLPSLLRGGTAVVPDPRLHWRGREAFVHVENAAAGLAAAVSTDDLEERVFNVVDSQPYAFDDFRSVIERLLSGAKLRAAGEPLGGYAGVPSPPPGPLSIERAERALGYRPARDLESGMAELVAAFRGREKP